MGKATLRHSGILVRNINSSKKTYERLGFQQHSPIENLKVLKMKDEKGNVIELVQGNWHPHIAVNWYKDEDDNYIEIVQTKGGK